MPVLDVLAQSSLMMLAAVKINCTLPDPPRINVTAQTNEIRYDFSQSSAQLSALRSNTVSPYGAGVDTTTGGLREDKPVVSVEMTMEMQSIGRGRKVYGVCLYYDQVNITIQLSPVIYLAREYNNGACRDAILEHERRHVAVDHIVINQFAAEMGQTVQQAVDKVGPLGPFKQEEVAGIQQQALDYLQTAVSLRQPALEENMRAQQAQVDSRDEYMRISRICHGGR